MKSKKLRNTFTGLAFLSPNITGFMIFTLIPLVFSMVLAFTNWDLRLHNMFQNRSIKFIGFQNFTRLFCEPDLWRYFGNTMFLMMGVPFTIAGSLIAAIMLNKDLKGGKSGMSKILIPGAILLGSCCLIAAAGMSGAAIIILLSGIFGLVLVSGTIFGQTVYRTLFYLPSFTSGVAVFILWKKLYSPQSGPLNAILVKPLDIIGNIVNSSPAWTIELGMWICLGIGLLAMERIMKSLCNHWKDAEIGHCALALGVFFAFLPVIFSNAWIPVPSAKFALIAVSLFFSFYHLSKVLKPREFSCPIWHGTGTSFMLALLALVAQFTLTGLAMTILSLPELSADGLQPPDWLTSYNWAKPSIMIMGLWGAIGSNNMLLYLAGLSNVPAELEEAADIDGAGPFQKFWHITWPQLAPITFFIVVMSVIGGLQGGFEVARTMTQGGPAGATTTLSYFIYNEGFVTGRLAYSSAISWILFLLVLSVTMINWKFGSKYVND